MTADELTRDYLEVIADAPCTATYAGADVVGTRGGITESQRFMEGGMLEEPDLQFTTTLSKLDESDDLIDRFTTVPSKGEQLTIDSVAYRIERVITDEYEACIQFDLMSVHR